MSASRSNVVKLHDRKRPKTYDNDSVFFTKNQIHVGTVMFHVGRLHPSAWTVARIVSLDNGKRHLVDTVQKFDDRIYLKRSNGTSAMAQRSATFSYLCYSAIWRVG